MRRLTAMCAFGLAAAVLPACGKPSGPPASEPQTVSVPGGVATPAEMGKRFVGTWEGDSPARPTVKVYLEVTRDRIIFRAANLKTNEWIKMVYSWRPTRAAGGTLVIRREEVEGERRDIEWSVTFTSDDAMSVTSLADGVLIANFRRAGRE